jgi:hypothetical protein
MSLRICIVGNSHVAALRRGWTQLETQYPETIVDIYGAPGGTFTEVMASDGKIVCKGERAADSFKMTGGSREVALNRYDCVVVVGAGIRLQTMVNLLESFCPPFMNELLAGNGGNGSSSRLARFYRKDAPTFVTTAMLRAFMNSYARRSNAAKLIESISAASGVKIYHLPAPLPSSKLLIVKPSNVISRLVGTGHGPTFAELIWEATEGALRGKAEVIRPPGHLRVSGRLTDESYSEGGARIDESLSDHDDEELFHMNGKYGVALMQVLLDRMLASKRLAG